MNGHERRRSDQRELPDPTRRAVETLRRIQPPNDLVASVVRQAAVTPQRRDWRHGMLLTIAGVGAVAAAVVIVAVAVVPGLRVPGPGASTVWPSSMPAAGSVLLRVAVPAGAIPGSADAGGVWVGHSTSGHLLRLDATTGATVLDIPINEATAEPYDLLPVSDGGLVWLPGFADQSLVRFDVASQLVTARWPIGAVPYRILPAGEVVWVTDFYGGRVLRIDARTGAILGTVDIGRPTGIAAVDGSVWVVDYVGDLYEIDPATDAVIERFDVAARASDIAVSGNDLLIWGLDSRNLERFHTTSRAVVARLAGVTGVARIDGTPWAAATGGLVLQLEPASLVPVAALQLGDVGTDQLAAGGGQLWAYTERAGESTLVAIEPRR